MNRALYGGSFDPIHAGHVAIVRLLLDRGLADAVHVVPAGQSPLKSGQAAGAPAGARLDLVRLACEDLEGAVVDDREIRRGGPSYTVETLAELTAAHPGDRWRLVVGADAAAEFDRWRAPQRILALAEVVVIAREGADIAPLLRGRARLVADFGHPASASRIRDDLRAGRLPGPDLLPAAVAAEITARGLYGWPGGSVPPTEERP
jgi:nicotinate-nucleotide adenylyltransferase